MCQKPVKSSVTAIQVNCFFFETWQEEQWFIVLLKTSVTFVPHTGVKIKPLRAAIQQSIPVPPTITQFGFITVHSQSISQGPNCFH